MIFGPGTAIMIGLAPLSPFYLPVPIGIWLTAGGVYNLFVDAIRKPMYDRLEFALKKVCN